MKLKPVKKSSLPAVVTKLPQPLAELGSPAEHAWHDFFSGEIPNPNTRVAYARAVRDFFEWCQEHRLDLQRLTPGIVGDYFRDHKGSPATKKQHLAGLRMFYRKLVERHLVVINPTLGVVTEKEVLRHGKTPRLQANEASSLLKSINTDASLVALRDYTIISTLLGTGVRGGGITRLNMASMKHDGTQYQLHFREKGGKVLVIPVRHDLEAILMTYINRAGLSDAPPRSPLFRTAQVKGKQLTDRRMTVGDIYRMFRRRCRQAGLPPDRVPHSVRVFVLTDLSIKGVPLEDIQDLAGHADSRTTRGYIRSNREISRNIVEQISVSTEIRSPEDPDT